MTHTHTKKGQNVDKKAESTSNAIQIHSSHIHKEAGHANAPSRRPWHHMAARRSNPQCAHNGDCFDEQTVCIIESDLSGNYVRLFGADLQYCTFLNVTVCHSGTMQL